MSTTTSSKYSNLPDIDIEQPDVYETPDVPDTYPGNQDDEPEAPVSADIVVKNISVDSAAARFRTAAGDVDPKSALSRYQSSFLRTLQLESLGNDFEVLSNGDSQLKETPEQRLRRLVFEVQELQEQVSAANGKSTPSTSSVSLMRLAADLKDELARLSTQTKDDALAGKGVVSRDLWEKLEGKGADCSSGASRGGLVSASKNELGGDATQIEKRISALEKIIGSSQRNAAKGSSAGNSLVDSISRLQQQMDVLSDPQRIDGIQRRVKQTLVDLERLDHANTQVIKSAAQAASSNDGNGKASLDPQVVKRIDALYEKFKDIDSLIELAPVTAKRLQSLAKLHVEASGVVARVDGIEKEQANNSEELLAVKEVAEKLQDSISGNSSTLMENIKYLDSRIEALSSRISSL